MPSTKQCYSCNQPSNWFSQALCCNLSFFRLFILIITTTGSILVLYWAFIEITNKSSLSFELLSDGRSVIKLNQSNQLIIQQISIPAQLPFVNTGINIKRHIPEGKELVVRANGCVTTGIFSEINKQIGERNITIDILLSILNNGKKFNSTSTDNDFMIFTLKKLFASEYNNLNSSPLRGPSGKKYEETSDNNAKNFDLITKKTHHNALKEKTYKNTTYNKTKDYLYGIQTIHAQTLRLNPRSEWGCLVGFFAPTKSNHDQEAENVFELLKDNREHGYNKIPIFEVNELARIKRSKKIIEITDQNGHKQFIPIHDNDMNLFLGVNDSLALNSDDLLLPESNDFRCSIAADRTIRRKIKEYIDDHKLKPYYIYYAGNTGQFNVNFTIE